MSEYDLLVIGSGPGGYVAAIRASQLGMKVACVEKRKTLGGTCLNIGCIPSKALLHASEEFSKIHSGKLSDLGIKVDKPRVDINKMMDKKNNVVSDLTKGIEFLFKKNKVSTYFGTATIISPGNVKVKNSSNEQIITANSILIASGSSVAPLKGVNVDEKNIVSSTGALSLKKIPESLVVIGGGYIGLEMSAVWKRLGSKVTVVEFLDRILPGMDSEIAKKFKLILEKQGILFKLNTAINSASSTKDGISIEATDLLENKKLNLSSDVVLLATGRIPNTKGLGLRELGVNLNENGQIKVDQDFKTNVNGIFAIGDVIPGPMLAHKAEEDGVAAVEIMAGLAGHVDYDLVPGIVYTSPEVATLGKTEDELKENKISYSKGVFPFSANSRARAISHTDGMVKILSDKSTDKILGVHIIGHEAGNLIHEVATAMAFGGSAEDIARTCHGHPTLNEAVKEAALSIGSGAIHI